MPEMEGAVLSTVPKHVVNLFTEDTVGQDFRLIEPTRQISSSSSKILQLKTLSDAK